VLAQQGERIRHIAIMRGLAENDTETQARLNGTILDPNVILF
jgi:hypothetical protein